ncbi:TRAP transporter small permease [Roseibium suaedae]|uniref:TRAP transporter small permease protein n=1 Tax=Roseibium suaedae TaxID=735517 RepID=A0A1M7PHH3_9HYPH|nr:TRAP transporter small permease [Roseibium suaedae]SHN16510.1 TRAP-type C4-dicarboxylate transport system, small permease component [Roseibium suaedae]
MEPNSAVRSKSAGAVFDGIAVVAKAATAAVLAFLVILVCGEAFLRSAFNHSLGFAEEVTGYCVVMLTFFGAALALRGGTLFQVQFLFDRLPKSAAAWIMRGFALGALVICLALMVKTNDLMLSSLSRGKFAATVLRTPLWIPQLLMPAGFALIGVFLVEQLLLTFDRFKR